MRIDSLKHLILSFALTALAFMECNAQIYGPAALKIDEYKHVVSFGGSYGVMLERPADFWGLTAGYAYQLSGPWALSPSLTYDKETDRSKDNPGVTNTFTFIGTISYFLTEKFSLTTGLAKGFLDDDNPERKIKGVNGDWSTGLAFGYNLPDFPFWARDSYGLSAALEYNMTKAEFSFSVDLTIGLAF